MLKNYLLIILSVVGYTTEAQNPKIEIPGEFVNPISTDRPGLADTPFLVNKSSIQIESGFNYDFNNDAGKVNNVLTYNSTLIRYGISENFEFRLTSEYIKVTERLTPSDKETHAQGINALSIGSKIFIAKEQGLVPSLSFLATLSLPYFGNKEIRPVHVAPGFRFMAQHTLAEKLSFSYNVGAIWDGNNPVSTGLYTVGFDYSLSKRSTLFIENFGFIPEHGNSQHGTNAGFCFLISQNFQFDISAGAGITDISSDGFINFGLSWTPKSNLLLHAKH